MIMVYMAQTFNAHWQFSKKYDYRKDLIASGYEPFDLLVDHQAIQSQADKSVICPGKVRQRLGFFHPGFVLLLFCL